ncbi:Gag-Pol polyprotein [Gossypium australe]|uniref:Gag-Pol polyprotein n=1 Tax=Gossypium australe TaxID=47621 RepID=A0A5B6X248_9ROSI|nr:Gag-Pol polyprotein [Gossypium australe]
MNLLGEIEGNKLARDLSVHNVNKPDCQHRGKKKFGECQVKEGSCLKCGLFDHFLRDCLDISTKIKLKMFDQGMRLLKKLSTENPGLKLFG